MAQAVMAETLNNPSPTPQTAVQTAQVDPVQAQAHTRATNPKSKNSIFSV